MLTVGTRGSVTRTREGPIRGGLLCAQPPQEGARSGGGGGKRPGRPGSQAKRWSLEPGESETRQVPPGSASFARDFWFCLFLNSRFAINKIGRQLPVGV